MSDIHQEWRELRKKNGDFLCHLDGEMDKLEKEKNQMIFYDPRTCTYFKADRDEIQEQINKLMEELVSNTASAKKMSDAYTQLLNEKADLQKKLDAVEKQANDISDLYGEACMEAHQAKVAKDRMGYSNRCMQSKIAKQANEIKRLTHENIGLVIDSKRYRNEIEKLKQGNWDEMERLQNANAKLEYDNFQLKQALGTSAKDAEGNFDRGYHRGMDELWDAIRKAQEEHPKVLRDIYGQGCMHDCVSNLSAQDFAMKTMEWEDKQAKKIHIGDEVEIFDQYDHSLSDIGIVIAIDKDNPCFAVIGPKFEGCFDETDIQNGNVTKTGRHFDSIPLDYFA